jgi:hypothetical protein
MDTVQKLSNPECYAPLSQQFTIALYEWSCLSKNSPKIFFLTFVLYAQISAGSEKLFTD